MTSPYRAEPAPIARYRLQTSPRYTSQLGRALILSLLVAGTVGAYWTGARRDPAAWALVAISIAIPPLLLVFGCRHFIAGGDGALEIYRDRIEVPRAFRRPPLLLPLGAAKVVLTLDRQTGAKGDTTPHIADISLQAPGIRRTLASDVFESPELAGHAADDIDRLQRGLEPYGPGGPAGAWDGPGKES